MSENKGASSRIIQIKDGVIGPVDPSIRTITPRRIGDYPKVPMVHLEIVKNYSSTLLFGPPVCDELVAFVQHMYTREEALLVRYLKPLTRKTASAIAKATHRPVSEVSKILEYLANDKQVILSSGSGDKKRYSILPIVGGTYEVVQMGRSNETPEDPLYEWRKRFAQLFEELYNTGYFTDFAKNSISIIRTIPIGQSIESNNMALPSDKLEEVFDRYDKFAVGNCGCRVTLRHKGFDCGLPLETCTFMGDFGKIMVDRGFARFVDLKEILAIKKDAEAKGLINWVTNLDEKSGRFGNYSCSCCGCCCIIFRTINEFNVPGLVTKPHFMPVFDDSKCTSCGLCAKRCQLGAITVDTKGKSLVHQPGRCIGCGQCVLACEKEKAIEMKATPNYKKPPGSVPMMGIKMLPKLMRTGWGIWKGKKVK